MITSMILSPNGKIVILYIARDMIQATVSFMEKGSPGKLQCKCMALGNVLEATNIVVPKYRPDRISNSNPRDETKRFQNSIHGEID
jgi:hypothetical protein